MECEVLVCIINMTLLIFFVITNDNIWVFALLSYADT